MSFFGFGGKKKKDTPSSPGDAAPAAGSTLSKDIDIPDYSTKRNIDKIVKSLIDAMNDNKQSVRDRVKKSLERIGHQEPLLLLSSGLKFLVNTSRSQKVHRVMVMDLLTWLMNELTDLEIPNDLANALIRVAAVEMVSEKSISSSWQNSACTLLVASARIIPNVAAQHLLDRFPMGKIPHYFVIKALADFAHEYPDLFIPHLKESITRTLPLLGMLKHDNYKWVFSAALGRWAESVVRCTEESEKISVNNVTVTDYSQTMHSALNHNMQDWLLNKQVKIRLVSAEGIGYMSKIIELNHLRELFPKLFPLMVKLLKKEAKHQLPIMIGFRSLIQAMMSKASNELEEHFELIVSTLAGHAVANQKNEKYEHQDANFDEFALTFETLAKATFTDRVVSFVLKQIGEKSNSTRTVFLKILNHLVMVLPDQLIPHRQEIITSVSISAKNDSIPMMHTLAELIRSLGERNYLTCTGGYELIQLVIGGAATSDATIEGIYAKAKGKLPPIHDPEHLRSRCDEILVEFATGDYAAQMDQILWPKLFKEFVSPEMAPAFVTVAHCVHNIGKRLTGTNNFIVDFSKEVNIPKPELIFARLIIMLAKPFERNDSGLHILRTLYTLSPNIHHKVVKLWAKKLRDMKKVMDGVEEPFSATVWENEILNFVRDSIIEVDDDQWNINIGNAILSQNTYYKHDPKLKQVLLSLSGLIIKKTKYQDFVNRAINDLFDMTNHVHEVERLGCARGLGQAAQEHIDTVLTKLNAVVSVKEKSKSSGWGFGSKKSKSDSSSESKATAMLTYGYVCRLTHPEHIKSRIQIHIVAPMMNVVESTNSQVVYENALVSFKYIARSIHPMKFKAVEVEPVELKSRDKLIALILSTIERDDPNSKKSGTIEEMDNLSIMGLEALHHLIRLTPELAPSTRTSLLKQIFALYHLGADTKKATEILQEISVVLETLLEEEFSQATLDDVFQGLQAYSKSKRVEERQRSLSDFFGILKQFAKSISDAIGDNGNSSIKAVLESEQFYSCGQFIGYVVPRITDDDPTVRQHALDCVYLLLRIQNYITTYGTKEEVNSDYFDDFGELRAGIRDEPEDPNELLEHAKGLSKILSKAIGEQQFYIMLDAILETLDDVVLSSAFGSTRVVMDLMAIRGDDFTTTCEKYIRKLIVLQESLASRERVCNGLAIGIRNLATHHHITVIETLLDHSTPHNESVKRTLAVLGRDLVITNQLFDYIIDMLNNGQLYRDAKNGQVSVPVCDSATAALHEILVVDKLSEFVSGEEQFPRLVIAMMLRVGSIMILEDHSMVSDIVKAISALLKLVKDGEIYEELVKSPKKPFELISNRDTYPQAVQNIMHAISSRFPEFIGSMFDIVQPFIDRTNFGHTVVSTCVISVLLHYMKNDNTRIQNAINCLLRRSGVNESSISKLYAIRGLGTLAKHPEDILQKFLTSVMTNLISCIEDNDEIIILETLKVVRELFSVAKDEYVSQLIINLTVRLKPAFEKANPKLRASSIDVFSVLDRFCRGSQKTTLINTIHSSFPLFVLHLQDDNERVRESCKKTLKSLVPELILDNGATPSESQLVDLFNEVHDHAKDGEEWGEPFNFDLFAKKFAVFFVQEFSNRIAEFTENMSVFYNSQWPELAAGAVRILGYMIAEMSETQRKSMNLTLVTNGLTKLLFSQHDCCRESSSLVLGLLHEA
mmetsp:Transcript_2945/g.4295  ORF Transcript_2945/g.4295 Transcript_2945/m.4295 type:complete len:1686 (-) Transcript_2945:16-5073(-)